MENPETKNGWSMPAINTVWRHYKGSRYLAVGECRLEATNERAVLYREEGGGMLWARSLADWNFDIPGVGPRFVSED